MPHGPQTSQSRKPEQRNVGHQNPLQNLDHHRSGGWRKDLDYYIGAYFWFNHPNTPEGKWPELKHKFFEYLLQHEEEWRALKESNPLNYMPYMASRFHKVTGLRVTSLETYTSWIKPGSYFHWMVAQKGQLGLCPHLANLDLPTGLMMSPPCLALPTEAQEDTWEEPEASKGDAHSSRNRARSDAHSSESRD